MSTFSEEHIKYLKKIKKDKRKVLITQISIIGIFLILWELLAQLNIINTFLYSSPSYMLKTIANLLKENSLFNHIFITTYETIISFLIAFTIGLLIAIILWWNKFLSKVFEPYLTIINSLPKVALGPLIIIWVGASMNSIIVMSLMISLIITCINLYNSFENTNNNYVTLLKTFKASKKDIFLKVILPSNKVNIINAMKINMSMNFIGVIMGELLVSKEGLGYLIMYGSQVFNINLVITSIIILAIISTLFYYLITRLEQQLTKSKKTKDYKKI